MRVRLSKYVSEYLNSNIIFAIDFLLSVGSSIIVLLFLKLIVPSHPFDSHFFLWWVCSSAVFSILTILISKSHHMIIRHSSLRDILRIFIEIMIKDIFVGLTISAACFFDKWVFVALIADFLFSVFFIISVRMMMIVAYDVFKSMDRQMKKRSRLFVFGTSDKSVALIKRFQISHHYNIVGLLSNEKAGDHILTDTPIFNYKTVNDLDALINKYSVKGIVFATDGDARSESEGLIKYCSENHIKTLIIPSIDELPSDGKSLVRVREVKIEDLLGRPEIEISMDEIRNNFKGKVVMVTGAAGSIGSELCRQIAGFGVEQLVMFDNAETPLHTLRLEMEQRFPFLNFVPLVGSVRHPARLDYAFRHWKPQIVFHAAAYKHVPLMEENPCEAVFANVFGSRNVADKCVEYGVEKMIMISTDKAVNPTNVMGCSKRLAEIYVQSLGVAIQNGQKEGKTRFVTTRFGNVLGSNGSVIPRFREQIAAGGPVTVTHPDITRFFMTIPEACRLVMEAATLGSGNDIFVFDMGESVKIDTLARRMISLAGLKVGEDIEIEYSGLRPGEKLYEEVLANEENTIPTSHDRIRIAKIREYEYEEVNKGIDELVLLAKACNVSETVKKMKKMVPEYKSANSKFSEFDK